MNKRNILYAILIICVSVLFTGCTSETLPLKQEATKFGDLKFIVHVGNGSNNSQQYSRAASYKKNWSVGDKIIMAVDGDDNKLCELVYKGNDDWNVSQISEQVSFSNSHGSLNAVHSDSLKIEGSEITTLGDILYSQDGSYEKKDDIVVINLDMNKRPLCRVAVVGMNPDCWIEGLKEYNRLTSLSSMNWDSTESHMYKEVYGDTCVFYGAIESDANNETTIRISESNGVSYERVYKEKLNQGDNVILHGPFSDEANLWTKHTLVHSITLDQTELNLVPGDSYILKTTIFNEDADDKELEWSCTNNTIATVDKNGQVEALANGYAQITVKSKDGSAIASCFVHIGNIEDFVSAEFDYNSEWGVSRKNGTVVTDYSLIVKNNYSKRILLDSTIGFSSNSGDVLIHLSEFSASISRYDLYYGQFSNIEIHQLFSREFGCSLGLDTWNQNWITIRFTRDNDKKQKEIRFNLPWTFLKENGEDL